MTKPSNSDSKTWTISGRFLVRHGQEREEGGGGPTVNTNTTDGDCESFLPVLVSDVGLSFWGGIDPLTGIVVDASHPLAGECVSNKILCLPSGRGSCTASQVLLELLLTSSAAPAAIVLRDADGLVCVGAIVAQEIFDHAGLDILCTGQEAFDQLLSLNLTGSKNGSTDNNQRPELRGRILSNGEIEIVLQDHKKENFITETLIATKTSSSSSTTTTTEKREATETPTFSKQETEMLNECTTQAERMALRVVFRYARLTSNNPSYLPIAQAHIDGCTYIGPGGLDFCRRLVAAGGSVKVPTTLNSGSTDRRRWKQLGVPEAYAGNAVALGDAYLQLGCQPSFTCAPYLLQASLELLRKQNGHRAPTPKDVAWGESNAVVYANSVLGARTEKYADYLDICCAIAGIVPAAGVHLEPNRQPTVVLDATNVLREIQKEQEQNSDENSSSSNGLELDLLFPILGHLCGSLSDGRVPILLGLQSDGDNDDDGFWYKAITKDDYHLKAFCAAFGTTGASPLIHIAGVTPEARDRAVVQEFVDAARTSNANAVRTISLDQLQETFELLDNSQHSHKDGAVDLVALGNPHLSASECRNLASLIQNNSNKNNNNGIIRYQRNPETRIIACMSRQVHAQAHAAGHIQPLRDFGVEFVFDTCWCMLLDAPIIPANPDATILTNSGKYSHYGPGLTQRRFRLGSMADCISAAATGVYPSRLRLRQSSSSSTATRGQTPFWMLASSSGRGRTHSPQQRHYTTKAATSATYHWRALVSTVSTVLKRWPLK